MKVVALESNSTVHKNINYTSKNKIKTFKFCIICNKFFVDDFVKLAVFKYISNN